MSCPYKGKCGGCHYIDISYEEELRLKEAKVLSLIKNEIDYDFLYDGITSSPLICEYKNKMEFTFGDMVKDGPLTLGMHEKRSFYNILNAENCELCDSNMREILRYTREYFDKNKTPLYKKKTHEGYLRHLVIRKSFSKNEYIINIVTTGTKGTEDLIYGNKDLLENWKELLLDKIDAKINILHTINNTFSDAVINEGIEILYGSDNIEEEVCGKFFNISPFSFFQTNTKACEKLYEKIKEYVGDEKIDVLYDMFCGTGTIGIILSDTSKKIIGVEIIKEAIDKAKENSIKNNITNTEYIAKDINMVVKDRDAIVYENKPDMVVLDPPRSGVNPKTLESMIELGEKVIIYVSCKIESFIENYKILKSHGFKIERLGIVDMFPKTDNVETVIKLVKI